MSVLRRPVLLTLVLLIAIPIATAGARADEANPKLVGFWHSVSIDGDALFFVVHGFQLDVHENGTFKVHVRFTDGETKTETGTFRLDGDAIELRIPSIDAKEHGTYSIEGDTLRFHDPSFGVSVRLARGKAKDSSGDELF